MADPDMLFDLNLREDDIHDALKNFFQQAGRAFAFDDDIQEAISVRAADLGFKDALSLMLPTGYQAVEIEGIYHIRKIPKAA